MDPRDLRREIDAILDQHDTAFRALHAARAAMHDTDRSLGTAIAATRMMLEGLAKANDSLEAIIDAHGKAIDAALTANQSALALLRHLDSRE